MGKYMKKGKITSDVAVMEVPQSALGVRTRARTLALQQKPELGYLQLRSRRLEKPQFPPPSPPTPDLMEKHKPCCNPGGGGQALTERVGSRLRVGSVEEGEIGARDFAGKLGSESTTPLERPKRGPIGTELDDLCVEASFGENNLEFDATGRNTRESTPCSFIRELDSSGTPGSAVRSTCSGATYYRSRNSAQRSFPSTHEMDDFFANAEMKQQKQFMEKYNFDVVNDLPLTGRYEWIRIDP